MASVLFEKSWHESQRCIPERPPPKAAATKPKIAGLKTGRYRTSERFLAPQTPFGITWSLRWLHKSDYYYVQKFVGDKDHFFDGFASQMRSDARVSLGRLHQFVLRGARRYF